VYRVVLVLAGAALGPAAASALAAQAVDSSPAYLTGLIEGLSPSARLRLSAAGERWTGRLESRRPDSLTLASTRLTRTLALNAIDTVWLRRERHDALFAAAGLGALVFVLLQIADDGVDRGSATRLGGLFFVGATTAGMAADALTDEWVRYYPE
jgi:hypothetical protein